jgi:hypothetical protein
VDDPVWQPDLPVLLAGPQMTAALLAGVSPPPEPWSRGLDLHRSVDVRLTAHFETLPAANVAAVLPGSDPALRDEYVVYTAHYDHLGISAPDESGDSIYNGFSDNAAGVAMLLAIAEALRDSPPARSVAFLFLTARSAGCWDPRTSPPAGSCPSSMAALINLDAGAPPAPPVSWRIAGGLSALGETARQVAEERGWTASLGAAGPNSDHWPFLQRGVPAIFIIPGNEWETPPPRNAMPCGAAGTATTTPPTTGTPTSPSPDSDGTPSTPSSSASAPPCDDAGNARGGPAGTRLSARTAAAPPSSAAARCAPRSSCAPGAAGSSPCPGSHP